MFYFIQFKNLFLKEISIERLLTFSSDEAKKVHFSNDASTLYVELKNEIKHKDETINKLELELRATQNELNSLAHGVRCPKNIKNSIVEIKIHCFNLAKR